MSQKDKMKISALAEMSGWFTLAEAAEKLSIILNEDITESGVLRLALAGGLKLSLNLPLYTAVRYASVVAIADEPIEIYIPRNLILPAPKDAFYLKMGVGELFGEGDNFSHIKGIVDLPLWLGDREIVEAEYCRKEGGKEILSKAFLIIVEHRGQYYCLQDFELKRYDGTFNAEDLPQHASFVIRLEAFRNYVKSKPFTMANSVKPPDHGTSSYSTQWLTILQSTIEHFYNPRSNPDTKREEVVDWIMQQAENMGIKVSENIATSIFTILKPANHDTKKKRVEPLV